MPQEKTFSRTYRFSGETIRKLLEIQNQRKFPSITLALEKIIAEAYQKLETSQAFEEKPVTLELMLQQSLGDELFERHIEFLEKVKKDGESLEDVFRKFIEEAGILPTKEEWKKRTEEGAKVDRFKIANPQPCHYRVITEEGEWYCDIKKIASEVCIKRQERFQFMGRKCIPISKRASSLRKKPSNRRFCKRDRIWFNIGEKDCLACKWLPTECPVKKEALK